MTVSLFSHPAGIVRSFLRNLIRLLLWRPECLFGEPNEKEGPREDHLESKWSERGEEEDIARLASHSPGPRRASRVQWHLTGEFQLSGFYPGFKTLSPNLQEAKDAYVVLRVLFSYLARGRCSPLTCKSQLKASTKCSVKWPVCCALSSDFTDQPTEKGGGGKGYGEKGGRKGRVA